MSGFVGANLEQLAALTATFRSESTEVDGLVQRIQTSVASTEWTGRVADEFRHRWGDEFRPALANLAAALEEAAVVIGARRDAIDQATNLMGR